MCLKWSAHELWSENFEILIFIECRTLNYIGPMTCRFFTCTKIFFTQIMCSKMINDLQRVHQQAR